MVNKAKRIIFFVAVVIFMAVPAEGEHRAAKLSVAQLTCEYRSNPEGIGTSHPRLSWIISSEKNGIKQTGYQIIVADDESLIKQVNGNIWDSGKIPSDASIQVSYNGPKLMAAKRYYWRVRVWDNQGNVSGWSSIATWRMGLLFQKDWENAAWIGFDELPVKNRIVPAAHLGGKPEWGIMENVLPLLRKEFTINKPIKEAVIFISGLGHFELSVNGKKAGDHFLDPGWTQYSKHALYVGFDLTHQLKTGGNALGVMLGNGFYHVPAVRYRKLTGTYGHPIMKCRLILKYADGETESIVSNSSWKTSRGPITFTSIFGGEDYDARLEQLNWNKPGFNDDSWKPAVITDGPPQLDATITEPLKVMQTFTATSISEPKPGIFVYDFGQNFSGIPAISVEGLAGKTIRLTPAEILDSNGVVNQQPSGKPSYFNYTLKGKGRENWQPQFTYYGFRYIQVEGAVPVGKSSAESLPVIHQLNGLHTRHSAESVGNFSCSNELFNDIFNLIDWSVKSNLASVLTDCPHREKLGWLEVAHLLGNSVRYNYNIASLYGKIIEDMKMAQTDNGLVPNIAPEWVQFDTDFRDSPEWGSSSVILPYSLYQWYDDKRILEDSYDMMKRYVDYLGSKAENHIVSHGLGDWFDIGPSGSGSGYSVSTPQGITGTAIYYYDLQIVSKVATILKRDSDAQKYRTQAEAVKKAFNEKFFNKSTNQYGTGSQTANAMAVYMDLVNPDDKAAVIANIKKDIRERGNRLTSGEVGYKHLLAVLEAAGESQVIFDMNSRSDVPGYGYQIAHGATTLMEDWQAKKTLGNNHCMLGHLLGWMYSGLAGIRQEDDSRAFRKIIIAPEIVGDVTSVSAKYRSPYGDIVSKWKKDADRFMLEVVIPVNTEATVYLPATNKSTILINGATTNGALIADAGKEKMRINLGSGSYTIIVEGSELIPMPKSFQRLSGNFNLSLCKSIVSNSASLGNEAGYLQRELQKAGFATEISGLEKPNAITLKLENVSANQNAQEAYRLTVNNNGVVIRGNSPAGIFYGIQTLLQLSSGNTFVKGCDIIDYPAFQWRGYMVDVGRNYQSVDQLKQQIDIMSRYKLNVFHFHLTEDVAWRLQIKKYPQLTAPEHMQRNKGKFYSVQEMHELIKYCRDRHITLVPEIDIPGHSKAFTRAIGADMQSEKGTAVLKEVFEEVCATYDFPYVHIGADEVKITNAKLIPEISAIIRKHNKKIIAWAPGGNYDDGIVRQLWKEEGDKDITSNKIKYIDSKFLYISDFDPLNSVVTIFNRRLGEKPHGDSSMLGAEFCMWNDRMAADEKDLISKNPVYPAMLAFAERSWRGNGYPGVNFHIGDSTQKRAEDFREFEVRLLSHKEKYFAQLPFTYVKQTNIRWKLFGPFENNGNLSAKFWPEKRGQHLAEKTSRIRPVGGTIWLWHTHGPEVKAWLPSPKENTTWYAFTRFRSNSDSTIQLWIDFKDLSRSGADATPPAGQWDQMKSCIWINGKKLSPPKWTHPGRPSGKLEEPMVDENYYYRLPFTVSVRKGWNEVLLKLPMGKFDPLLDWQVPPKWMFTVIPVTKGTGINWDAAQIKFYPGR